MDIMDSIHFHLFHLYDISIKYVINILSVYVISTLNKSLNQYWSHFWILIDEQENINKTAITTKTI